MWWHRFHTKLYKIRHYSEFIDRSRTPQIQERKRARANERCLLAFDKSSIYRGHRRMSIRRSWKSLLEEKLFISCYYKEIANVEEVLRTRNRSAGAKHEQKGRTEMQEIHWLIVRIHPFSRSSGQIWLFPLLRRNRSSRKGGFGRKDSTVVRACSPFIRDASYIRKIVTWKTFASVSRSIFMILRLVIDNID